MIYDHQSINPDQLNKAAYLKIRTNYWRKPGGKGIRPLISFPIFRPFQRRHTAYENGKLSQLWNIAVARVLFLSLESDALGSGSTETSRFRPVLSWRDNICHSRHRRASWTIDTIQRLLEIGAGVTIRQ